MSAGITHIHPFIKHPSRGEVSIVGHVDDIGLSLYPGIKVPYDEDLVHLLKFLVIF